MSPTATSTNNSIAVRAASATKFLSYFATACSSSPQKDAKNTLIICSTREAFIQTLLGEYDAIVGEKPVTSLAFTAGKYRTSDAGSQGSHDREQEEEDVPHHEPLDTEAEEVKTVQEEEEEEGKKELVIKDSEGESSDELLSIDDDRSASGSGSERQLPIEEWPESPPHEPPTQKQQQRKPSSPILNLRSASPPVADVDLPFGFSARIENLTAASKVHKIVFCPSLPHLRAYIASVGFSGSIRHGGGGGSGGGMLGIYDMFRIHSPLELSVQGISRTLSAAVDATMNGKLVVCVGENDEKSTLRLANVGMVGKGLKNFGGDGFEEDEGDQGEIEGRWNVPLEDVLGRWMKIEAVE